MVGSMKNDRSPKRKPLSAYSLPALADLIGGLDAKSKANDLRLKEAKQELVRRSVPQAKGRLFIATRLSKTRIVLSRDLVLGDMGRDWTVAHSKHQTYTSVVVTVRKSELETVFGGTP